MEFFCLLGDRAVYWQVNGKLVVGDYTDLVVRRNKIRVNNVGHTSQGYFECGFYHLKEKIYAAVAVGILLIRGNLYFHQ